MHRTLCLCCIENLLRLHISNDLRLYRVPLLLAGISLILIFLDARWDALSRQPPLFWVPFLQRFFAGQGAKP